MAKKFEGLTQVQVKVLHTTGGHAWPVAGLQEETNGYLVTEPNGTKHFVPDGSIASFSTA